MILYQSIADKSTIPDKMYQNIHKFAPDYDHKIFNDSDVVSWFLEHDYGDDVITKFNGKVVTRSRDLPRIVAETPVDRTVPVDIIRNGDKVTIDITLGELEKAEKSGILASAPTKDEAQSFDDIGLSVAPLSKSLAEQFGLEADEQVVVVTAAAEEGPSAIKGIVPGDIIRRLNQTRITSVADFAKVLETAQVDERKGVLMLIESDGQTRFVQVSFK